MTLRRWPDDRVNANRPEPGRAPLVCEALAGVEAARLLADPMFRTQPKAPDVDCPVLIVPGFMAPDSSMTPMVHWLRRIGYFAYVGHTGLNLHCSESTAGRLATRLAEISRRHDRRVVVIGHSRGGQLARVLATRHPEHVAGAITMGTPTPLDIELTHPLIRYSAKALNALSSMGLAGMMNDDCFRGDCCAQFRRDLAEELDPSVRLTCIIGACDALVDRAACVDPSSRHVDYVRASHCGTIANSESYRAIACALSCAWDLDPRTGDDPWTDES